MQTGSALPEATALQRGSQRGFPRAAGSFKKRDALNPGSRHPDIHEGPEQRMFFAGSAGATRELQEPGGGENPINGNGREREIEILQDEMPVRVGLPKKDSRYLRRPSAMQPAAGNTLRRRRGRAGQFFLQRFPCG